MIIENASKWKMTIPINNLISTYQINTQIIKQGFDHSIIPGYLVNRSILIDDSATLSQYTEIPYAAPPVNTIPETLSTSLHLQTGYNSDDTY
jgi:hypothetical protein